MYDLEITVACCLAEGNGVKFITEGLRNNKTLKSLDLSNYRL